MEGMATEVVMGEVTVAGMVVAMSLDTVEDTTMAMVEEAMGPDMVVVMVALGMVVGMVSLGTAEAMVEDTAEAMAEDTVVAAGTVEAGAMEADMVVAATLEVDTMVDGIKWSNYISFSVSNN